MPNHIRNVLTIKQNGQGSEAVQDVFDFLQSVDEDGETRLIDFNNLIPMPKSLNITSGSTGSHGLELLQSMGVTHENCENQEIQKAAITMFVNGLGVDYLKDPERAREAVELGAQYIKNKALYGHTTWYDWCCEHWGTKWNAYDMERDGNTITFDTAWSSVFNLIEKLSQKFPHLFFEYKWSDEDTGHNVGEAEFENGECTEFYQPDGGSKEAFDLAFEIRPYCRQYYKLVDGEYEYNEDEE